MARFIGTLKGNRGGTSRLGHATTGLRATVEGWNLGVEVEARVINDEDVFYIYKTEGSTHGGRTHIATIGGKETKLIRLLSDNTYAFEA